MKQRKTFKARMELKSGTTGAFEAVFATLNVIDHDGDVTLPGAFRQGQRVVIEGWNHDQGLPVGAGSIHADKKAAVVAGRFFLDTTIGRDHYNTVKELRPEWSYTFEIEKSEEGTFQGQKVRFLSALDVWGVAPVTRGAGVGTGLLDIKHSHTGRLGVRDALWDIASLAAWSEMHKTGAPADPAAVRIDLDALLVDVEISDIEARVKERGDDHPTHRDHVRAQVAREWPGTSEVWIEAMTSARLAAMAGEIQERDRLLTDHQAHAWVAQWARRPAV